MATSWRTINIFLSSTFNDMQGERDAIRKLVVPRLNEALKSRNISVEVTDLRWGIDTSQGDEAMREAKVLHVCMETIRNTRPYFIALIGERYGWVPSVERFDQILRRLKSGDRRILESLDAPCSVTEMEILLGAIGSNELIDHSCFCFRQPESYMGMSGDDYESVVIGDSGITGGSGAKLAALKEKIKDVCIATGNERSIVDYRCHWNRDTRMFDGFADFARAVEERLLEDIIGEDVSHGGRDDYEDSVMESFMASCAHSFVGRGRILNSLLSVVRYCSGREPGLLGGVILSGPSGVGKSYVISAVASLLESSADDRLILLAHMTGLTPRSVYVREMRARWERLLRTRLNIPENSGDDFGALVTAAVGQGYRLVALIDAMDVFSTGEDPLSKIPVDVFVVATATPDVADDLMRRHQSYAVVDLDVFSRQDAIELIDNKLKSGYKELPDDVRDALIGRMTAGGTPAYESPLWLNMALTMIMEIGADDFRQIHNIGGDAALNIRQYLKDMIESFPAVPDGLFMRMIEMSCRYFDPELTLGALTYMAVSPFGIEESQLQQLLGDHWDALEFESLRYWMGSMIQMVGADRKLKLAHAILTGMALSSSNELLSDARRQLSDLDYADFLSGRISLSEAVYRMIYRSDVHGLRRLVESRGEALNHAGVHGFAFEVFRILENDVYTVMRLIDCYFKEFTDCDIYDWAKCWISDLREFVDRSSLYDKAHLVKELDAVQTRYTGADRLFGGNRRDLDLFLSSNPDHEAMLWVADANMRLYGPGVFTRGALYWIFFALEAELFTAVKNARDDETLAPVFLSKLYEYIDRAVSLIGQVPGGNVEIRKALAQLNTFMNFPGFLWDVDTFMKVSARIHSLYLDMWPEFGDDVSDGLKASYMHEYSYGADSLIYAYMQGCSWVKHPVTPLMEHFNGRDVVKFPSKTMPELSTRALLKPSAADVDETVRSYEAAFPSSELSENEKIRIGVHHHLAQAEYHFILGDKRGVLDAIGQCDDSDRYSNEVCEWLSLRYPYDTVTMDAFDRNVDEVLKCIVSGKEFEYTPVIGRAWEYDREGRLDRIEALLLRASEFMLLRQVDARFLYDDESYERGNYTDLDGIFGPYKDTVSALVWFGCKDAAVTALLRWMEMCDMTYVDRPAKGDRHYSWAEEQLGKLGAAIPARKYVEVKYGQDFVEKVTRIIFKDEKQEPGWSGGVRRVTVNDSGNLILVTYLRYNTAHTAIFSPDAELISDLDRWKFVINFGDNDITLAGDHGMWSFITRDGRIAFDGTFRSARPFHQGRAAVTTKRRTSFPFRFHWGFVDEHGREVVPMIYEEVGDFHCGRATVVSKGRYGVIDMAGNIIVPCEYDHITSFYQGYAYAFRAGICYRIDAGSVAMSGCS